VAVAAHHLHLVTLLTLPYHSGRAYALGHPDLASALIVANPGHGSPDGMVWISEKVLDSD